MGTQQVTWDRSAKSNFFCDTDSILTGLHKDTSKTKDISKYFAAIDQETQSDSILIGLHKDTKKIKDKRKHTYK